MKIQTTHVGSLPRPQELLDANAKRAAGEISDQELTETLKGAVDAVVKKQKDIGIDIINDGEYGHITSGAVDYGAWWNYSFSRLGGLTMTGEDRWAKDEVIRSTPGHIRLTNFKDRRDCRKFEAAYTAPDNGVLMGRNAVPNPAFTAPVTYVGQELVQRDIRLLKDAMAKYNVTTGFMAAISPGAAARLEDKYYNDEDALLDAVADAMHEEYKAITDAGLIVQLDAPDFAEAWDQINPEPTLEDYRAWLQKRVNAANRALRGIDPEQVRLHICWGSWHGPHTTDIPFADIADLCLQVNAKYFSFESESPRHQHEWKIWKDLTLPEENVLVPGFISHSTNVVEHPDLIADHIVRFAEVVGPERVIASSDCGLGGRLHEQIAWAKLESLVEGAKRASERLGAK